MPTHAPMATDQCQYLATDYPRTWAEFTAHLPAFDQKKPAAQAGLLIRYFDHCQIYIQPVIKPQEGRWGVSVLAPMGEHPSEGMRLVYNDLAKYPDRTLATLNVAWAAFRYREAQLQAPAAEKQPETAPHIEK